MKISARNVLKGKVKSVIEGAVNAEVVIELKGGETVTSIKKVVRPTHFNLSSAKAASTPLYVCFS